MSRDYPMPPDKYIDMILSRIEPVSNWSACWIWKGKPKDTGYGAFGGNYIKGRSRRAHRRVYETAIGPIPDGLTIDHLCQRKLCVNPLHLEPVTQEENTRRIDRTLCRKKLHEMTGRNVRIAVLPNGRERRQCRPCDIAARKVARDARREGRLQRVQDQGST